MRRAAAALVLLVALPAVAQQGRWNSTPPQQGWSVAEGRGTGMGTGMGTAGTTQRAARDAARTQELSLLTQLQGIDEELLRVQEELLGLEERVSDLEVRRESDEEQLSSASESVSAQKGAAAEQLGALYRLHRQGLARVIFGAEDPADLRRRGTYLMGILNADLQRIADFRDAVARKREAVATVEQDVRALDALRLDLEAKATELREAKTEKLRFLDSIRSKRDLTMRINTEFRDVRSEVGDLLGHEKELQSPGSASALPASPPGEGGSFRARYGRLPWPVSGRIIKAVLGQGIDLQAEYGTPVRSVHGGVVRLASYVRGYGQTVAVQHGAYKTVYAHLTGLRVKLGERVTEGQVVGLVGNTGLTDGQGYVLTFEVRYNGTKQDPRKWLQPR